MADAPKAKISVRISVLFWADILVGYALFVMQDYLTSVWNLSFTHAAGILNIWGGICLVLPVIFLFLVDTRLGNFTMLVISSVAYSVGIGLVTMSTPPVLGGSCKRYEEQCIGHKQKVLFYTGMALIAIGISGNSISLKPFLEEQTETDDDERSNCCMILLPFTLVVIVALVGAIGLPYVKPWKLRFGIPAICTTVAMVLFLSGSCIKRYKMAEPEGSPITNVFRVFVAFAFKLFKSFPLDAKKYHNTDQNESFKQTRLLRCLEKAAIIMPGEVDEEGEIRKRWRLCSIGEVEDAKIAVRMIPMWLTFVVCGIVSSIGNTYFVEQANNLNRHLGKWNVPLQIFMLISSSFKNYIFGPLANCLLKKSERYASIGIGIAMAFSVLCCITAAKIEHKRLNIVRRHGLLDKPDDDIPMSIYWLIFQFVLLSGLDSFLEKSVASFYEYQAPKTMTNYLEYFAKFVSGLGFVLSVLSVYVVGKISERKEKQNWFQSTLNESRLDRYYWVLASLSAVNLVIFTVVALFYRYERADRPANDEVGNGENNGPPETNEDADQNNCNNCCCC